MIQPAIPPTLGSFRIFETDGVEDRRDIWEE